MPFEMLVGLNVVDSEGYQNYRKAMTPMLASYGGTFRYDFLVDKTLKGEATHDITRLFILSFPDRDSRDRFFKDEKYLAVRRTYLETAVKGRTVISEYER